MVWGSKITGDKEMKIYMRHVRSAKICSSGARQFLNVHGISWQDFLQNGVEADVLLAMNNAQVNQVVEAAKKELNNGW